MDRAEPLSLRPPPMPRFTAAQHMKMTNRLLEKAAASKTPDRLLAAVANFLQLALRSQRLTEIATRKATLPWQAAPGTAPPPW